MGSQASPNQTKVSPLRMKHNRSFAVLINGVRRASSNQTKAPPLRVPHKRELCCAHELQSMPAVPRITSLAFFWIAAFSRSVDCIEMWVFYHPSLARSRWVVVKSLCDRTIAKNLKQFMCSSRNNWVVFCVCYEICSRAQTTSHVRTKLAGPT